MHTFLREFGDSRFAVLLGFKIKGKISRIAFGTNSVDFVDKLLSIASLSNSTYSKWVSELSGLTTEQGLAVGSMLCNLGDGRCEYVVVWTGDTIYKHDGNEPEPSLRLRGNTAIVSCATCIYGVHKSKVRDTILDGCDKCLYSIDGFREMALDYDMKYLVD